MTSRLYRISIAATILVLIFTLALTAQSLQDKCDQYLTAAAKVHHFQGAALVAKDGKVLFAKGYGMADVEKKAPNTPETVFLLGSITKQFTATAIMQLVEQGKVSLDSPLTAYLTDYPSATGSKVTIHHLLTHTSGIPSYTDMRDVMKRRFDPISKQDLVALFKNEPLQFEPGTQWRYDNSGYFLLGMVIEKVSGEPYARYLQTHIFKPLGMKHTGYCDSKNLPPHFASPYVLDSTRENIEATRLTDMSWPFAAGALYSTVGDMLLWDRGIARHTVLSAASYAKMTTPFLNHYAYGITVDSLYGRPRESHGGDIDGFNAEFERYPNDSLCVVMLANNGSISVSNDVAMLAAIAFEQPYDLPVRKQPVPMDSAAMAQYTGVYQIAPDEYRVVSQVADSLFARRTGSGDRRIYPEAKDKFYYEFDNSITLTFLRDSTGTVTGHRIRQAGVETNAMRLTGPTADSIMQSLHAITVDPAILALYAGEYELMPGFTLTVTVADGHIFAQGTGQAKVELYPRSNETFSVRQVGAEVSFVRGPDGRSNGLILTQYGQTLPAKRIR